MTSICGIIRFDGPVDAHDLEGVLGDMQVQPGLPARVWSEGPAAIGACDCGDTDVQPIVRRDKGAVIAWEGRLDNREELLARLALDASASELSDGQLVQLAFARWHRACPEYLLGDFAFAIWDPLRAELFCATDAIGACPLYYAVQDRFFAFASTEEALLHVPGVSAAPDEEMLASWLVPAYLPSGQGRSWLRDVRVLGPAATAVVSAQGALRIDAYWKLQPGEPLSLRTHEEAREAFESVFVDAVRSRTRDLSDVAVMLSGGLDSAAILGATARLPDLKVRTYSLVCDDTCDVETRYILELAAGVDHTLARIPSLGGPIDEKALLDAAWSRAHPCDNSILLPALMCMAAHNDGRSAILHGASGDITTHVPTRYPAFFLRQGQWRRAWHECLQASAHNNYLRDQAPLKLLALNAWTAFAPTWAKQAAHRAFGAPPSLESTCIEPGFARRLDIEGALRRDRLAGRRLSQTARHEHAEAAASQRGLALGLAGIRRLGKRFGIDPRDPWADRRVVEFFVRMPLELKVANGWTKAIVRSAFAETLSDSVRWRIGKEHLGYQLTCRLLRSSRDQARALVSAQLELAAPYVDTAVLAQRFGAYLSSGDESSLNAADPNFLNEKIVLLAWLSRLNAPKRRKASNMMYLTE